MTLKKKESGVNSRHKEGLCWVSVFCWRGGDEKKTPFSPWERSDRVHYFLVSCVCLVKRSVMVINMRLWEHSATLLLWVNWIFIARTAFPLRREHTTKRKVLVEKLSVETNLLCHYSDKEKKKETELSVRCVSPRLFTSLCETRAYLVWLRHSRLLSLRRERSNKKGSWHFKFYWLVPFRSVWTLYTHTHTQKKYCMTGCQGAAACTGKTCC